MPHLSLPTKNQFAFTHTIAPNKDEIVTIGHHIFIKKSGEAEWSHEPLSNYFAKHALKTDEEKHDAVSFPVDTIDAHFFNDKGVEMIVANNLLYYRAYPSEMTWHVSDHLQTAPASDKRLIISPIAHVALEGNTMFVDSGEKGFSFTIAPALGDPKQFRCLSCHETSNLSTKSTATTICPHCSCAQLTQLN